MRLFFALDLDADAKVQIDDWRQHAFPRFERWVPPANFHITLAFLGECHRRQLEALCAAVDDLTFSRSGEKLQLKLDDVGYWPKPGILWLGCRESSAELAGWAKKCRKLASGHGLHASRKPYIPHMTLARRLIAAPPAPTIAPVFSVAFDQLLLFESISGASGISYRRIASWPLSVMR